MTAADYRCVLLYLVVAVAIGFADLRMRAHTGHVISSYIPGVVANTEPAPGKYRVLMPFTLHGVVALSGASLETVWYLTRLTAIFVALCIMHMYLRSWFRPDAALTGVAVMAATLPLTFTNSWPHPDAMPELALFTLGALAIARRHDPLFGGVLALAALNRETSAFLVLLYFVAYPLTARRMIRAAAFGLEWILIYSALRLFRGFEHYDYWQAGRNLSDLALLPANYDPYYRAYAYFGLILFGPMLYLALQATPPLTMARRALVVVPCFVAVAFSFSNIIETRIFTPLYPLILPALVSSFHPASLEHRGAPMSDLDTPAEP
jgi:hypothetical protein